MGFTAKEVPESRGLFVILLLADMLNTITREIIMVANGNRQASATAAIIMFVLIAFLFFGLLAIVHFVYLCCLKHHYTSFISSFIQTIGALLYFYGDNITYLVGTYNTEIGCGAVCVSNNRIAASFSLGVALIIFQIVPPVLHRLYQVIKNSDEKEDKSPWFLAIDMITVLVKIDTLFSAVVVMVISSDFCSRTDIGTSASFIIICVIIGIGAEIVYCIYAQYNDDSDDIVFTTLNVFGLIVIVICFPLYILADNLQPLDCAFGCDTLAANTTINDISCNQVANSSVRLGFTTISFICIAVISTMYFSCNAKEKGLSHPV